MQQTQICHMNTLALHKDLFYATKSILFELEQIWVPFLKEYQLTVSQISILYHLSQVEISTVSEIAKSGCMHISSAQNSTKKLADRGLLQIQKSHIDSRITNAYITEAGLALLENIQKRPPEKALEHDLNRSGNINQLTMLLLQSMQTMKSSTVTI
ncbi:transcriptional regulator, SarA/Rot family [Isobaculum melis]|uniref:DNA-binding transcriptional regulator, MarR family n=1 Tax=Isobaculum melis TaxID=142588 RepID=A0A1H9UFV1_9LACT|nr:MarR family transcriptional regulator [Isobaculum melis]SES08141.1 DNA-binding transcriptional regulator, MarR family [Isobaculum melis]